jgi:hypothetical protein
MCMTEKSGELFCRCDGIFLISLFTHLLPVAHIIPFVKVLHKSTLTKADKEKRHRNYLILKKSAQNRLNREWALLFLIMSLPHEPPTEVIVTIPKSCADVDNGEILLERKPAELVKKGSWVPSRAGQLITIQQWRVLDGNFKFCCNGRLIYGPGNWYWWIFVIIHLIITTVVCIYFE